MSARVKITLVSLLLLAVAGCFAWKAAAPPMTQAEGRRRIWAANNATNRGETTPLFTPTEPPTPPPDLLPTPTDLPPTPTETLLPPIELPTPEVTAPVLESWTGAPTYLAESQPGYFFRVDYSPLLWALVQDEMGLPTLVHRGILYCQITPTAGRGVPRGLSVDSQFRDIGLLRYEVVTVSQNSVAQYVNYFGGDGVIQTGFQVSFQEQAEACLQTAESVLATLSSIPEPTPTPTPTPTDTLIPTETPTLTPTLRATATITPKP